MATNKKRDKKANNRKHNTSSETQNLEKQIPAKVAMIAGDTDNQLINPGIYDHDDQFIYLKNYVLN